MLVQFIAPLLVGCDCNVACADLKAMLQLHQPLTTLSRWMWVVYSQGPDTTISSGTQQRTVCFAVSLFARNLRYLAVEHSIECTYMSL